MLPVVGAPPLVAGHAQDAVAHVIVHPEHVGVLVMDVVVGVLSSAPTGR